MRVSFYIITGVAALCSSILAIFHPITLSAQTRLPRPKSVIAFFEPSLELAVVNWQGVRNATSYFVRIKDENGEILFQKRTKRTKQTIESANLVSGHSYTIGVRAVSQSGVSQLSKTRYTHVLSRSVGKGALLTKNSAGRSGSYFLPTSYKKGPKPVLLGFHGSGGTGRTIVNAFAKFGNEYQFIIVAPSSRLSPEGVATWEIGDGPNEKSEDFFHAVNCLNEVREFEGVQIDETQILALGYSAGGTFAPYFATNGDTAHQFASLHNALHIPSLGSRIMPGWLSTGLSDPLSPPEELLVSLGALEELGYGEILFKTYNTDHSLVVPELRDVIKWWLR